MIFRLLAGFLAAGFATIAVLVAVRPCVSTIVCLGAGVQHESFNSSGTPI